MSESPSCEVTVDGSFVIGGNTERNESCVMKNVAHNGGGSCCWLVGEYPSNMKSVSQGQKVYLRDRSAQCISGTDLLSVYQ